MPCNGNTCTWTFDDKLQMHVCTDSTELTCSLSLVFIHPEPPTDRVLANAANVIEQAALDVLGKISPQSKCIGGQLYKPTFRLFPQNKDAGVFLKVTEDTSDMTFLKAEDIDGEHILADAATEILLQAENILAKLPYEGGRGTPGFTLKESDSKIFLSWVNHGEDCSPNVVTADAYE